MSAKGVHAAVLEDVRSGVADFGIGYVDELPDFVAGTALSRETFCVVMPERHRLADRRGLSLLELRDEPMVGAADQGAHPAHHRRGGRDRRRVAAAGGHGQPVCHPDGLVGAGVGIAIVPKGATQRAAGARAAQRAAGRAPARRDGSA